jgi:mannose/fructose/N-acetylgalactosamine-specific phosphotransferase system component IIC
LLLEYLFDMKKLIKFYLLAFVLFSDFVVLAQGPGEDDGSGGLGGGDPVPVAPINGQLMALALVGIAYAIYTFRNYKKIV